MLLDLGQLQGPIVSKLFKEKMGSCSTHEIQSTNKTEDIIQSLGISGPKKFTKQKLGKNKMNVMGISSSHNYTSKKAAIFVERRNGGEAGVGEKKKPAELSKDVVIENSPHMSGIDHTPVEHSDVDQYHKVQITQQLQQVWSQYPRNIGKCLRRPVMEKLQ